MEKDDWETLLNYLMLAGLLGVIISGGLACYELFNARSFCKSIGGDYSFDIKALPPVNTCDGEPFHKYVFGEKVFWELDENMIFNINSTKFKELLQSS